MEVEISDKIHTYTLFEKAWEIDATRCQYRVCIEKSPNIHKISILQRGISINR